MTTEEIVSGYHAGTVTEDAFVWKGGDGWIWIPLLEQLELRAAIEPPAQRRLPLSRHTEPAAAAPAFPAPPAQAYAAGSAMDARRRGSSSSASSSSRRAGAHRGWSIVNGAAESVRRRRDPRGAKKKIDQAGRAARQHRLRRESHTGARNENSVLFSLDSLIRRASSHRNLLRREPSPARRRRSDREQRVPVFNRHPTIRSA
jgi:hypothetical protein